MTDYITSLIRTWVPVAVGAVLSWLAANLGIVVDEGTQAGFIAASTGILTGLYYAIVRLAEKRWPSAGVLLGRTATPTYGG